MRRERLDGPTVLGEQRAMARVEPADADLLGLESFVAEHYPRLIRLAGLITHDVDEAQDAVQTALERAWRARGSLGQAERLRSWIDRIVVREAIRLGGRRRGLLRLLRAAPRINEIDVAERRTSPSDVVSLRLAYSKLSTAQRTVVALHLYAGYSVEETAAILGIPHDTVRSRLRSARERLRREMAEVTP